MITEAGLCAGKSGGAAAIDQLFTPGVIANLEAIRRPTPSPWDSAGNVVRERHLILRARDGSAPSPWRAARRRAWADYLDAASVCGLLADKELVANLTGTDDDSFRGAMAECMATWVLARLGFAVEPKPEARSKKNVDLRAGKDRLEVFVEVKAPFIPIMSNPFAGDDARGLRQCVEAAGKQFKPNRANVVLLAPVLRTPLGMDRSQLVKAVIGEHALQVHVTYDGSKPPPTELTFLQEGKLARLHRAQDGSARTDFTRISAVMSVEESVREDDEGYFHVHHFTMVVHNPFAAVPLSPGVLGSIPQLVHGVGEMHWTDD